MNIAKIRVKNSLVLVGHVPSEAKDIEASDKLNIIKVEGGCLLTWTSLNDQDRHADTSQNAICSTFVPVGNIVQIIIQKEYPVIEKPKESVIVKVEDKRTKPKKK